MSNHYKSFTLSLQVVIVPDIGDGNLTNVSPTAAARIAGSCPGPPGTTGGTVGGLGVGFSIPPGSGGIVSPDGVILVTLCADVSFKMNQIVSSVSMKMAPFQWHH